MSTQPNHEPQTPKPEAKPTIPTPTPDPWTVKPSGSDPLPLGVYMAVFEGVEPYSNEEKGIIGKWRWQWGVKTGPHAGKKANALTDQTIKATTLPGRLISGMAGRSLTEGENVKTLVDGFKNKTFLVNVAPGPKGGKAGVQSANIPPEM